MLNLQKIPVYIISFNRLKYLQRMIEVLEKYNLRNIHIIDNQSSYPPLLEYLAGLPYQVHYMEKNYGHKVFFEAEEFRSVRENDYYVLTDPDVIPIDECPADFMDLFYNILKKHKFANKVGFSLKIDDLPDHYSLKSEVIEWETAMIGKKISSAPDLYKAYIDTTFALYRPQKEWVGQKGKEFFAAVRTGYPYEARHLPWYKDLSKPTEEDIFYNKCDCGSGTWNGKKKANEILRKNVYVYKLFNILPLIKCKVLPQKIYIFLFGFIPLFKIIKKLRMRKK